MKINQLIEATEKAVEKKTHDECSDEIDAYHDAAMAAILKLETAIRVYTYQESPIPVLLSQVKENLKRAMDLAQNWNDRCE